MLSTKARRINPVLHNCVLCSACSTRLLCETQVRGTNATHQTQDTIFYYNSSLTLCSQLSRLIGRVTLSTQDSFGVLQFLSDWRVPFLYRNNTLTFSVQWYQFPLIRTTPSHALVQPDTNTLTLSQNPLECLDTIMWTPSKSIWTHYLVWQKPDKTR